MYKMLRESLPEWLYSLLGLPLLDCLLFGQVVCQLVLPGHPLRPLANIGRLPVLVVKSLGSSLHFPSNILASGPRVSPLLANLEQKLWKLKHSKNWHLEVKQNTWIDLSVLLSVAVLAPVRLYWDCLSSSMVLVLLGPTSPGPAPANKLVKSIKNLLS